MMPKSKICTKCKVEKALEEFHKRKCGKFGRVSHCKVCVAEYREKNRERIAERNRQYNEANRERIAERNRQYYEANRERILEQQHQYSEENRERISEQKRRYYEANREEISERNRQYNKANRERVAERCRQYNEKNRERILEWQRQYNEENPEKRAAIAAKRRAAKLNRTPSWADLEHIKQFYEARKAISDATGRDYHVDHMVPLQGKTVSGLHVPGNLQIIPAKRNITKSNTF
jgi:hypothetical protein